MFGVRMGEENTRRKNEREELSFRNGLALTSETTTVDSAHDVVATLRPVGGKQRARLRNAKLRARENAVCAVRIAQSGVVLKDVEGGDTIGLSDRRAGDIRRRRDVPTRERAHA
jgi:hypothetical protein